MAGEGRRVTVTDAGVALTSSPHDRLGGQRFILRFVSGDPVDIDLRPAGEDGLTAGASFPLQLGDILNGDLDPGEMVYAITASGKSAVIAVLESGI